AVLIPRSSASSIVRRAMASLRNPVKQVRRAVVTVVALTLSLIVAGCGSSSGTTSGATAAVGPTSDSPTGAGAPRSLVMIIRHGTRPHGEHEVRQWRREGAGEGRGRPFRGDLDLLAAR